MKKIIGKSVSKGIVQGTAYVGLSHTDTTASRYAIEEEQIEEEINRLRHAIQVASTSIQSLQQDNSTTEVDSILESQYLMLNDASFVQSIEDRVSEYLWNVEWVVQDYIGSLIQKVSDISDDYLSERAIDLYDVLRRLMSVFSGHEDFTLDKPSILVCYDLTPTELLSLPKGYLLGLALDAGGLTSHTAILATAMGIPCVLRLSGASKYCQNDTVLILDGNEGLLFIEPDAKTQELYATKILEDTERKEVEDKLYKLPPKTKDGTSLQILANVRIEEEIDNAVHYDSDGIGLYCSEFLFLRRNGFSGEEEQYQAYSRALLAMGEKECVIRTLDIGGDKLSAGIHEQNPLLGLRSLRFSFQHRNIFFTQLRALLRASTRGRLSILFPMVSTIGEVEELKIALDMVRKEFRKKDVKYAENIPLGVMIEVPSAVMIAPELAEMVDFFSIGTNDLVQYTMAVDRGNEYVSHLYNEFDPAVIRMLKYVIDAANAAHCPVTLCGEMAGNIDATAVLLGLGLRSFSVHPNSIVELKKRISTLNVIDCVRLADEVLAMRKKEDIINKLQNFHSQRSHQ